MIFRSRSFDLRSTERPRSVGTGFGFGLWFSKQELRST